MQVFCGLVPQRCHFLFPFKSQVQYLDDRGGAAVHQTVGLAFRELLVRRLGVPFNMNGAEIHAKIGPRRQKLFVALCREYRE